MSSRADNDAMIEALREEDTAAAMIKAAREGDIQECERLLANDGELKNAKDKVRKEPTAQEYSCWFGSCG